MWQFRALGACSAPGSFTYEEILEKYNLQQWKAIRAVRSIRRGQVNFSMIFKDLKLNDTVTSSSLYRRGFKTPFNFNLSPLCDTNKCKLYLDKLKQEWIDIGRLAIDRFRESRPLCPIISLTSKPTLLIDDIGSSQPVVALEDRIELEHSKANELWNEQLILQKSITSDSLKLKDLSTRLKEEESYLSLTLKLISQYWRVPEDISTCDLVKFDHDLKKFEERCLTISNDLDIDSLSLASVTSAKMLDSVLNLTECCGQLSGELKSCKESMVLGIDEHIDPVKLTNVINEAMDLENQWRTEGLCLLKKDVFTSNGMYRPASWPRFLPTSFFYYKLNSQFIFYKPLKTLFEKQQQIKLRSEVASRLGYSLKINKYLHRPDNYQNEKGCSFPSELSKAISCIKSGIQTEVSQFSDAFNLFRNLLSRPVVDAEVRYYLSQVQGFGSDRKDRLRSYGSRAIDISNTIHLLNSLNHIKQDSQQR